MSFLVELTDGTSVIHIYIILEAYKIVLKKLHVTYS